MADASPKLTAEQSATLARWWDEHGPAMRTFAKRRLTSSESAEDLVQEALVSAAVALARGEEARSERTLLFTLLRRRIVDHVRKTVRGRRVQEELAKITDDQALSLRSRVKAVASRRWAQPPAEALQRAEFWAAFEACLDGMPTLMRQAMLLREIDGLATDEVCQTLSISKANLWTLIHRARLRLRDELSPLMTDDDPAGARPVDPPPDG